MIPPRERKTDQNRLPKKRRAKKPPRFQITDRDIEFIRAICKYRFLLLEQLAWLFPEASKRGIENRLRYMYHNKYLDRLMLSDNVYSHKLIYAMAEKGARLLAQADDVARDEIAWNRFHNKVGLSHIQHLLDVNDVLISYEKSLADAQDQGRVKDFKALSTNPDSHRISVVRRKEDGSRYESSVIPDAIIGVKFKRKFGLFFVEVDRGTMSLKRWMEKIIVYREYMKSSELKERFHTNWFIVLTVTTSERRIMSLAKKTVFLGGKRGFWYTVAQEITPENVLEKIWTRASDLYQGCDEGTHQIEKYDLAEKASILDSIGG
ncbi:replication-relaxation family protein [bacterium]|nr:replication-relaxation family protein [bacterium]